MKCYILIPAVRRVGRVHNHALEPLGPEETPSIMAPIVEPGEVLFNILHDDFLSPNIFHRA